jgi:hypothetical protein
MDVRLRVLGLTGRASGCDGLSFADHRSSLHGQRPEVSQGCPVSVRRRDRDRQAVGRHLAGEGDASGHGRTDRPVVTDSDVDAAVLPSCVGIVAEGELA